MHVYCEAQTSGHQYVEMGKVYCPGEGAFKSNIYTQGSMTIANYPLDP